MADETDQDPDMDPNSYGAGTGEVLRKLGAGQSYKSNQ
jgi:hypothetical protein